MALFQCKNRILNRITHHKAESSKHISICKYVFALHRVLWCMLNGLNFYKWYQRCEQANEVHLYKWSVSVLTLARGSNTSNEYREMDRGMKWTDSFFIWLLFCCCCLLRFFFFVHALLKRVDLYIEIENYWSRTRYGINS